ncbi:hypothetical protein FQN57_004720 [Myotisia sp. PD_48]|nr:hypothetical protein FQN57_004720 [Myotisia sp. PD_48]
MARQTKTFSSLRQLHHSSLSLPQGSYIYSLCKNGDDALAVISSDDSLRRFDRQTLQLLPDGVIRDTHTSSSGGGVTALCADVEEDGKGWLLATSGRDGTVKFWDTRTSQSKSVVTFTSGKSFPLLSLACQANTNSLVAGTELQKTDALVVFWDIRSHSKPRLEFVESHNDDVTELQFHPTRNNVLLSGSTDGLVNIYDTTITNEDDALLQVVKHSSIHQAGFLDEKTIYALSHDEIFSIHPLTSSEEDQDEEVLRAPSHFGDLRPVLQCEYVAQVLVDRWGTYVAAGSTRLANKPLPCPILFQTSLPPPYSVPLSASFLDKFSWLNIEISFGSQQTLDLVPLSSTPQFHFDQSKIWKLPGSHGEELVRSVFFDSESQAVYTCGEDGYVRLWKEQGEGEIAPPAGSSAGMEDIVQANIVTSPDITVSSRPTKISKAKTRKQKGYKPY